MRLPCGDGSFAVGETSKSSAVPSGRRSNLYYHPGKPWRSSNQIDDGPHSPRKKPIRREAGVSTPAQSQQNQRGLQPRSHAPTGCGETCPGRLEASGHDGVPGEPSGSGLGPQTTHKMIGLQPLRRALTAPRKKPIRREAGVSPPAQSQQNQRGAQPRSHAPTGCGETFPGRLEASGHGGVPWGNPLGRVSCRKRN
jgi:hypothetical protein